MAMITRNRTSLEVPTPNLGYSSVFVRDTDKILCIKNDVGDITEFSNAISITVANENSDTTC